MLLVLVFAVVIVVVHAPAGVVVTKIVVAFVTIIKVIKWYLKIILL